MHICLHCNLLELEKYYNYLCVGSCLSKMCLPMHFQKICILSNQLTYCKSTNSESTMTIKFCINFALTLSQQLPLLFTPIYSYAYTLNQHVNLLHKKSC